MTFFIAGLFVGAFAILAVLVVGWVVFVDRLTSGTAGIEDKYE